MSGLSAEYRLSLGLELIYIERVMGGEKEMKGEANERGRNEREQERA